ncbi:hypothetical protein [Halobacillus naozhouensis]|uniref:Uncharacterized protein n=1 Tax=Halobacillus naozhouensis TaxID=554880 RepID=A0ABY8J386_9BACI|nr:hypothetical protein [Halobacillus naozhouensis]WFT76537.1 hypothetical protein P9989_09310 [Halobacillus naozhouensis]
MVHLSSYQVHLKNPIKTNQIMNIYKHSTKDNTNIYFHQHNLIADAGHLPKLLSFFLLMDIDEPLLLIIDGDNATGTYEVILNEFQGAIEDISCRAQYIPAQMYQCASITV